jgi:opacity protein-like surface antigen
LLFRRIVVIIALAGTLEVPAYALDRNAKLLFSYGGELGGDDLRGAFADLELALNKRGTIGLNLGGRIRHSDRVAEDTNQTSVRAGMSYYPVPDTRIVAGLRWISADYDESALGEDFSLETTTVQPYLLIRQRLLSVRGRISPFVFAGAGYAFNRAELKGEGSISQEGEDSVTYRLGGGVDIRITEPVDLSFGYAYSASEWDVTFKEDLTGARVEETIDTGGWMIFAGVRIYYIPKSPS